MGIALPIFVITVTVAALSIVLSVVANRSNRSFFSRFDGIRRALPGLDCTACGYAECVEFAEAIAKNAAPAAARCIPGGPGTAHTMADVLGTTASIEEPKMAVVHCKGGRQEAYQRSDYRGVPDCQAAVLLDNGSTACSEGCCGLGSCVRACPFGALSITGDGIASVNRQQCNGCGVCVAACPRGLISLIPHVHKIYLACSSHDCGEEVTARCAVGCTACRECEAITSSGAVIVHDNLPHLDYSVPGENFVAAACRCPPRCFVDLVKTRPRANIDTKCDGCSECTNVCPVDGAIVGAPGKRHVVKKELCAGCGRCLTVCPAKAISLWGSLGYLGDRL